jgi:hypothetical protein
MRRRRERLLDAYRDDRAALSARERARVESWLRDEPSARRRVERTDRIGRTIRSAWTDVPPAPSAEYFLAAIRPELRRIETERAAGRAPRVWGWRGRALGRPASLAAFMAVAAAMAAVALWPGDLPTAPGMETRVAKLDPAAGAAEPGGAAGGAPAAEPGGAEAGSLDSPSAIYDLAQEEAPLMVFEAPDGSTVIWMLEGDDDVSRALTGRDGWV